MRVYKYELLGGRSVIYNLPINAEVLHVQAQHGVPQMWVKVDPGLREEQRHFGVFPTGDDIPDGAVHRGTFQLDDGNLVFHLFELPL